ncbi:MAG: lamin tail domain-containing protein, partial [Candidatus Paceibacterota bacterium]
MKHFILAGLITGTIVQVQALTISEVMSNPTGDDNGREWIEVYNEGSTDVDISSMTVSIKGGTAVVTTPLQGGTMLPAGGYVIIGSTVSGSTKFLQDYPSYAGILFKSSISLVNTGVTSIDIKLNGSIVASLPSYTAAKEGSTLSYIGGSYVVGTPTPGSDNQATDTSSSGSSNTASTTTPETQVTLPQMSPPTSDIIIYMPEERVVVAGADSEFSVFSQTRVGKPINDLRYSWAFGDGGQATGSSTNYRYVYPGRYIAQVEAVSATTIGSGRMVVRVVSPDISITSVGAGKYGAYIDIRNPNTYDIDLSQWRITIDGASFPFPKNTWLLSGQTTRFPGSAMGFASTTLSSTSSVKIVFPSLEEVTHYEGAGTST